MTSDIPELVPNPQVVVFDICETLYFSNTTHDFIAFIVAKTGRGRLLHRILNSRRLPFRYFLIAVSRYFGVDPLRSFNISMLKGYSNAELRALAKEFVRDFLYSRKVTNVHRMMRESKDAGKLVILCSTSIEPVVSAIASELDVERFISTTIKYDREICTGSIERDVGCSKLEILHRTGIDENIDLAVSDNRGDLKLLKAAKRGVAVVHAKKKESFWKAHNLEIIRPAR